MSEATTSGVLEAALSWAASGRRVFPLVPGTKQPAVAWSTEATTDEAMLHAWFAPGTYGLGLPTGDGLIVVDVDVAKGGEIPDWAPHTYTVHTPSGGWHLYYRVGEAVPNSVGRLADGVDVRGDGGYVVAPPTPGYTVAIESRVADLDPLLLTAVQRRGGAFSREPFQFPERGKDGEVIEPIGEGMRNDWMLRACGHGREMGIDDEATLTAWAEEVNQLYLDPPLEDNELRRVVQNSLRYLHAD